MGVSAEELSFCDGDVDYSLVHDKVINICPEGLTVTLGLVQGFRFARPVFYPSLDASDAMVAAIEDVTFAPGLNDILVGRDDGAFSTIDLPI